MELFSKRLRELRNEKGLSMKGLATLVGTTDAAISNWENGINEPKISYLKSLALFFNVSADYLLGLEDYTGGKIVNSFNNSFNGNNSNVTIK